MKKTKIVATLGPETAKPDAIKKLIDCGMSVVRLNGSHNTIEWHIETIRTVRSVNPMIPILVDLPGRKIRTAAFNHQFTFKAGETLILTSDLEYKGKDKAVVNYANLHKDLKVGDNILADDGTLKFIVRKIEGKDLLCEALVTGTLKQCKGINVPYVKVNTPLISERDIRIMEMCKKENVDFVGVSFVESGTHVEEVYKHLEGSKVEVIAKVENQFGVDNLESIVQKSFGILIDRGDLSAETKIENISLQQKRILREATRFGKPVIVATEMLHTMIENPVPTKAEVNDITNAILDGGSATMLSGESAVGKFPFAAVEVMKNIALEVESFQGHADGLNLNITTNDTPNVIGKCISEVSRNLPITKIICFTNSGFAARMISRYRLNQDIIAVTDSVDKARKFNLYWGVMPYCSSKIEFKPEKSEHITYGLKELYENKIITKEDTIVVTAVRFPSKTSQTRMNYFEIHNVRDLIEALSW